MSSSRGSNLEIRDQHDARVVVTCAHSRNLNNLAALEMSKLS
jgi:hypothetical protein